jgi:hypothetical protein
VPKISSRMPASAGAPIKNQRITRASISATGCTTAASHSGGTASAAADGMWLEGPAPTGRGCHHRNSTPGNRDTKERRHGGN